MIIDAGDLKNAGIKGEYILKLIDDHVDMEKVLDSWKWELLVLKLVMKDQTQSLYLMERIYINF